MFHLPSFKNVFMAVYQCQPFDLISALFVSFYSIKCVLPHFEVSIKSDKYEADFPECNRFSSYSEVPNQIGFMLFERQRK